ncbi:hypothetical protein pb186bvf_009880 [Paramecium bursaria]
MAFFNGDQVYYTDQNLGAIDENHDMEYSRSNLSRNALKFINEFRFNDKYIYRDAVQINATQDQFFVEIEIDDIQNYDASLYDYTLNRPFDAQETFQKAVKESYCSDKMINEDDFDQVPEFQVQFVSQQNPLKLAQLNPTNINKLVTVSCIVISSKSLRVKAYQVYTECRECNHVRIMDVGYTPGPIGLPRICLAQQTNRGQPVVSKQCPADPYVIIPEKCRFVDLQMLRIQELPESIETGEIPRNYTVYSDRYLVNGLTAGQRAILTGAYCIPIKNAATAKSNASSTELSIPYIHIMGIQTKRLHKLQNIRDHEQQTFKEMASSGEIYKIIKQSIAPQIYGHDDIKLALACLLFGGSTKYLPDGMKLRGDINVLLIGDPSTAKSQLLKFIERACDISVYTSGKGSSAAGLTASITFQNGTQSFALEAGALVLASGGVCCIDEFDKMRAEDRVAMHEAMEQQTISIAKAGITTRLNAKCSILAAANPIFGRYQDNKSIQDQIELQTTILSRFDAIFIVKDIRTEESDARMAKHIIGLHADQQGEEMEIESNDKMLDLERLKKYVRFAKQTVSPRLNEEAAQLITNMYVQDREKSRLQGHHKQHGGKSHIPITVRQLEAIIRLSESIAKIYLCEHVTEAHVKEAHRLFQNSTMAAVSQGAKEFGLDLTQDMRAMIDTIQESILRRIHIGSKLPYAKLMEELMVRFNNARAIEYTINKLVQQEVLQQMDFKNLLIRKK